MKIHYLQHVPFEGLGFIEKWARTQNATTGVSRLFRNDPLPGTEDFDWLVVMGGPMGIYDHDEFPWLVAEKKLIQQAIGAGKTVLGICLGAQLIADVLGAKVYPGPQKEIGWFPIKRAAGAPDLIPDTLTVFHWHGDTFDLPEGAVPLASSAACKNQGFIYNGRVVALQFHMETTVESMEALIENCGHELPGVDGASCSVQEKQRAVAHPNGAGCPVSVQTADAIRAGASNMANINAAMAALLDQLRVAPQRLQ